MLKKLSAYPGPTIRDLKIVRRRRGRTFLAVALAAATALTMVGCSSSPQETPKSPGAEVAAVKTPVKIVAFKAPSLGAFLPVVIADQHLDAKHGLDLQFTYATPDNYNSEFGAGHYDVGASAGLLSEGLRTQRGADVTYLFNLFDFYGTVVTSSPDIKNLTDLKGHTLAAATGTTNYAMFQWFSQKAGLKLSDVQVQNQTTAGLSTMALTGRTDATELWEPAYSTLLAKKPGISTISLDFKAWKAEFGTSDIPYLGVAAQTAWAKKNPKLVQALYETYKEAGAWVTAHPKEASALIAKSIPGGDATVLRDLIENNDRLGLHVVPASKVSAGIKAAFKAAQQTGYLTKEPPESVIYTGLRP